MSITSGITDGSLFGGTGNDSFNFTGGRVTGLVDTGAGSDSLMFGALGDSLTLTGELTGTSVNGAAGADSFVVKSTMLSASLQGGDAADTFDFTAGSASIVDTTIKGGNGADNISLYGASDVIFDIASGDSVFGGTGADTLLFTGSVLNNSIHAGSGNDSIVMSGTGMTGNTIDLGLGLDTLKFTDTSSRDHVIVTNTTITGAKSLTFEKAATAPFITTGAGADVVVFEGAVAGSGVIATHSGNDSIQFLKNATFNTLILEPVLIPLWSTINQQYHC